MQLVDLDSGVVTPFPSLLDGDDGFDKALLRSGWVAAKAGYRGLAFRDGSALKPIALPAAWQMCPGAAPDEVLMTLFKGRSREDHEGTAVVAVGADGVVRRTVDVPLWGLVGEVDGAIVAANGMWSWTGEEIEVPGDGEPMGVLNGELLVLSRDSTVEVVDARGNRRGSCAVPSGDQLQTQLDVQYDASASRLATTSSEAHGILVAFADADPRWIPVERPAYHPVWLGEHELLLFNWDAPAETVVLDVTTGSTSPLPMATRAPQPIVDVTGRLDPAEIRAALRPTNWSPPSPEERDASLDQHLSTLNTQTPEELQPFLTAAAAPTVRLRSCLPPRRLALGGSRLGGRPDLPPGTSWPRIDGRPLAFLAQLRLDEISPVAPDGVLPPHGLLIVFVDLEPDGMFPTSETAVHVQIVDTSSLKRRAWPRGVAEELRFDPAVLIPEIALSLPDLPAGVPEDDEAAWLALVETVKPPSPHHQMLGHPITIQGHDPPEDGSEDDVLLLQIDSDAIAGMAFGDGGSFQFWVPPDDFRRGDLTRCRVDLDCF